MNTSLQLSAADIDRLRRANYNATIAAVRTIHSGLRIIRLRLDDGRLQFEPGQYVTLGIGNWESCPGDQTLTPPFRLLKRPYSVSARMLDQHGELVDPLSEDDVELYISLAPPSERPGLTPRLFQLGSGDRLFLNPVARGRYTLAGLDKSADLIFAATGTGEAPHNAMIAHLLFRGHCGRILSVVGVRYEQDLAYRDAYRILEKSYSNLEYVCLTTREPRNVDPQHREFVGKEYLQRFFAGDRFDRFWKSCDIARTRAFVCGNADMIGHPITDSSGRRAFPQPRGLIEVLEARGLRLNEPHRPGTIFTEKFW